MARVAEEKRKREIGKEPKEETWGDAGRYLRSKITVANIIVVSSIYGLLYGISSCIVNSPSYLTKKEDQERKESFIVAYNCILPPEGEKRIYILKDGSRAVVSHEKGDWSPFSDGSLLNIDLDGKTRFSSIDSDLSGEFNFNRLNNLFLYDGDGWEKFDWRSQKQWQKRYEDLVIDLYDTRKKFENSAGQEFDNKLKNLENMKGGNENGKDK